jgi:hypothetical protein
MDWALTIPSFIRISHYMRKKTRLAGGQAATENFMTSIWSTSGNEKEHPRGSKEWQVLAGGADFRLRCKGCAMK